MSNELPPLHVAVAVILDTRRQILLSRRSPETHQGGLWEFPGGKVEAGEDLLAALQRELKEELDIEPGRTSALLQVAHDYGDRSVLLDVHVVWDFYGTPAGLEGQPLAWVAAEELERYPFPAANEPIVRAVRKLLVGSAESCRRAPGG
jgi:8-oxo-dGTP diphosphatase